MPATKSAWWFTTELWAATVCFCGATPGVKAIKCIGCVELTIKRAMREEKKRWKSGAATRVRKS